MEAETEGEEDSGGGNGGVCGEGTEQGHIQHSLQSLVLGQ